MVSRLRKRVGIWLVALVLGSATQLGCTHEAQVQLETALAKALVSDQEEAMLGARIHRELERDPRMRLSRDPVVVGYVERVATPILERARADRSGIDWYVHVIDDPETVNAFATPGGHIYVHSGLVLAAKNEAELAGVIAHEAGHITTRHAARQMVNTFGLQMVASLALGQNPSTLAQVATAFAARGVLLAHSRRDEIEADEVGARYAAEAGYDPQGLVAFLETLMAEERPRPGVLEWLSTHPTSADRISNLQSFLAERNLRGGVVGAERIEPIQRHIVREERLGS